jgi:ABC-2 type transport system ATP-binding protein
VRLFKRVLMPSVVATTSLTRRFGAITAVDRLSIDVPVGGVIGLVGPNGSGKSTLIRMLLGLIRPTEGSATVLGTPISSPAEYAARVGALVESPAFVSSLSARANLVSLARLRHLPLVRVDKVLSIMGLIGRDMEPVRNFSLGMKQRLGIAAAMLPDPELLILDEPANGLDPAGIVEIRGLLRSLGQAGRTVIVSSHLLAEVQAACDYLVVVRFGELVFAGPMAEIMARTREHVDVRAEHARDTERLCAALTVAGWDVAVVGDVLRVAASASRAADLNRAAMAAGVTLSGLVVVQDSLEDIFLAMTGRTDGELARARAITTERVAW